MVARNQMAPRSRVPSDRPAKPKADARERSEPAAEAPAAARLSGPMASYAVAAGSARVAAYAGAVLARQVVAPAAGPLSDAQLHDAIAWTEARYDELSIGTIQHIAATPATRVFDSVSAQAVATFQQTNGLLVDGKAGHQTLTQAFPERVGRSAHDQLIHTVADLENIDITTDISAVRFDQTLATAGATEFDPSGLRVIKLGAPAFASSRILRDTLRAQKRGAAPAAAPAGAAPAILDPLDATLASLIDGVALSDPRSVRAVAAQVRGPRTSAWTEDLVQRLAAFQVGAGLPGNGIVDQATVQALVAALIAANDNNGAIRLIVDFFDFDDSGNLISIYFDPNETANAETTPLSSGEENQPASIQVGPAGMAQDFPGLVHTIEHEFVHVRLMRENETDIPTQEFLAESVEMTSPITPNETIAGFMNDADRGLREWNKMPAGKQITHRARFIEVRQRIHDRHNAATPAEKVTHQPTVDRWDAQVLPVGPPAGP
jgi:peptidoglycan hydrolase-like protein with peptidoglycan-binding domain